jgi:ribose/xylose/arabinose/galactoside ABC-type transport system permease subunit
MYKVFSWIGVAVGLIFIILGLIGGLINGAILVSPRGCIFIATLCFVIAINFSLLRLIALKEEKK